MTRSLRYNRPRRRRPARRYCGLCGQSAPAMDFVEGSSLCSLCRSRREARR